MERENDKEIMGKEKNVEEKWNKIGKKRIGEKNRKEDKNRKVKSVEIAAEHIICSLIKKMNRRF